MNESLDTMLQAERTIEHLTAPDDAFDRLLTFKARRDRGRRLASAAIALVAAAAGSTLAIMAISTERLTGPAEPSPPMTTPSPSVTTGDGEVYAGDIRQPESATEFTAWWEGGGDGGPWAASIRVTLDRRAGTATIDVGGSYANGEDLARPGVPPSQLPARSVRAAPDLSWLELETPNMTLRWTRVPKEEPGYAGYLRRDGYFVVTHVNYSARVEGDFLGNRINGGTQASLGFATSDPPVDFSSPPPDAA